MLNKLTGFFKANPWRALIWMALVILPLIFTIFPQILLILTIFHSKPFVFAAWIFLFAFTAFTEFYFGLPLLLFHGEGPACFLFWTIIAFYLSICLPPKDPGEMRNLYENKPPSYTIAPYGPTFLLATILCFALVISLTAGVGLIKTLPIKPKTGNTPAANRRNGSIAENIAHQMINTTMQKQSKLVDDLLAGKDNQ